jgi:hypothetical protein
MKQLFYYFLLLAPVLAVAGSDDEESPSKEKKEAEKPASSENCPAATEISVEMPSTFIFLCNQSIRNASKDNAKIREIQEELFEICKLKCSDYLKKNPNHDAFSAFDSIEEELSEVYQRKDLEKSALLDHFKNLNGEEIREKKHQEQLRELETAKQPWKSVLGDTQYPVMKETKVFGRYFEKITEEIILPALNQITNSAAREFFLAEKDVLKDAVFFFNDANPSLHILHSTMRRKTEAFLEHSRYNFRKEYSTPRVLAHLGYPKEEDPYPDFTEQCPDFQSFLWYLAPNFPALPEELTEAGLNESYKKNIQTIPFILAAVGEAYTNRDNPSLLNERIGKIFNLILGRLEEYQTEKSQRLQLAFIEKIRNHADKLVDKRNREASSEKLLRVFRAVKALRTQFEPLKEKLDSIKNLVPTSSDFINSVKEKIASIKPSKIYFNQSSLDDILKIDMQTVSIDWQGNGGAPIQEQTVLTLANYLKPGVTLDFATPVADFFRHNSETKNWDFRLVQTNLQGVSHVTLCTINPEEQNSIVRALIEKNILTPLRKDGLITDEKKAEEAPVDPAPVEKTYEEKREERKAALRKRQQEREKQQKEEDQE